MDKRKKIVLVAGAAVAMVLAGGGLAYANGTVGERETTVTGPDADRAGQAATTSVGSGSSVVEVVRENEGAVAYEVTVKKSDGTVTDVGITKDFTVAPAEATTDTEGSD